MPKVSVIMPAYNVEKYIGGAIESIIAEVFDEAKYFNTIAKRIER